MRTFLVIPLESRRNRINKYKCTDYSSCGFCLLPFRFTWINPHSAVIIFTHHSHISEFQHSLSFYFEKSSKFICFVGVHHAQLHTTIYVDLNNVWISLYRLDKWPNALTFAEKCVVDILSLYMWCSCCTLALLVSCTISLVCVFDSFVQSTRVTGIEQNESIEMHWPSRENIVISLFVQIQQTKFWWCFWVFLTRTSIR